MVVVVAIIAIIAAIGVAIFQDMTRKARLSADQDTVANLRSAVALYDAKTNEFFSGSLASINTLITLTPFCQCAVKPSSYDKNNGKLTHTATIGDCP